MFYCINAWCAIFPVLNSLSQHYNLGNKPISAQSSCSSISSTSERSPSYFDSPISPATSTDLSVSPHSQPTPLDATQDRRTFVCIEILPKGSPLSCLTSVDGAHSPKSVFSSNGVTDLFRPSSHPRPIYDIDPTITLMSHSLISAQSSCLVMLDGANVHKEITPLILTGPFPDAHSSVESPLLYSVKLIPSYWESICSCSGTLISEMMLEHLCLIILQRSYAI